jgi:hypothetical protein
MPYAPASDAQQPTDKRGKVILAEQTAITADIIRLLARTADAADNDLEWNQALRNKLSGVSATQTPASAKSTPMQILIDSPTTTHNHPPPATSPARTSSTSKLCLQLAAAAIFGGAIAAAAAHQLGKTPYDHPPPTNTPAAAYELRLDVGPDGNR